ncbi:hypothetical protein BHM03_00041736 [Ensete ventricosum]|nr:hypothetical protein BHM03_00041736 [Ensete ventricosum]
MRLLYSFPRPRISLRYIWPWSWAVTAPKKKKEAELANGGEPQEKFECASCPPFKIGDVRAAIPSHCWVKDPWRSMSYVLRDVVVIAALALAAGHLNSWIFWHIYWLAQGTMFWAIFVLGHDWYYSIISSVLRAPTASRGTNSRTCVGSGHGSFSDSVRLNNVVGHLLHSAILVPYHGWLLVSGTLSPLLVLFSRVSESAIREDVPGIGFVQPNLAFQVPFPLVCLPCLPGEFHEVEPQDDSALAFL